MDVKIGIADDHRLFSKSLGALIEKFQGFRMVIDAVNGDELIKKLEGGNEKPDVMLLDVNMPVMNGAETARQLSKKYPSMKLAALSQEDDDESIIKMFRAGCSAYLLKDILPQELMQALEEINRYGYYNADPKNLRGRRMVEKLNGGDHLQLSSREREFLQLACSDKTYRQIASEMFLSERTIDGYRESLFDKLDVQSRVGMVLEGLKRNIITF